VAIADFAQLRLALCEVAGCALPRVGVNDRGVEAFSVLLDGIEITLAHDVQRASGHVLVLVRFGALPHELTLAACMALLRTNSLMPRALSPSFGLDPIDGDVLLQHAFALAELSAQDLYASLAGFAEVALAWRSTYFLDTNEPALHDPLRTFA
jgi:hypothetical protein